MRLLVMMLCLFWGPVTAINAAPLTSGPGNLQLGLNLARYPDLKPIPGYPVYYAPRMNANYFFYDGLYWVFQEERWYFSSWYNGPWGIAQPEELPSYVLRIPVRYYRQPPVYFRFWQLDEPPRWGDHWGREWQQRRQGWHQRPDQKSKLKPLPLPVYQRRYTGARYPNVDQQRDLHQRYYRFRPRDELLQSHYRDQQDRHRRWLDAQKQGRQDYERAYGPDNSEERLRIQRDVQQRQRAEDTLRRESIERSAPGERPEQQRQR